MGKRRGAYGVLVGNLREGDHMEESGINGRILLKWDLREVGWGVDWIDLSQDRDRWRTLVNAVMNLRFP
jgi:hypothetical protein